MPPEDKSRIEDLKKSLYSRTAPDVRTRRKLRFGGHESELPTDWQHPVEEPIETELNPTYEDHSMSFLSKLLIASAAFCLIAVGVGAYLFFNGSNLISANNIDITISGPVSIPGGEPVSFDVNVTNNNNVDLQLVDMSVAFPQGTIDPEHPGKELKEYRKLIGDISTGRSAHQNIQATIFGEENIQKQMTVTLTYSIKGSTSVFTKKKEYAVLINSSPITVSVNSFKEITSGQEFDLTVKVKSNSQQVLRGLIMKASYPFGYTYMSSNLSPLTDNATWNIGDLPAGADRTIVIHGKLQGEDTDSRSFRFSVGAKNANNPMVISTEYMSVQQDIAIEKPFVSLSLAISNDHSTGDYAAQFDQTENIQLDWFNNLTVPISNAVITLHLSGSAYDRTAIEPGDGNFQSATDDIVWNQRTNPELASIEAGGSGHVTFNVVPRNKSTPSRPVINPSMTLAVSISGNRTQESNVPAQLTVAASRTIKVSSDVSLSGRVLRSIGPFVNTGTVPPRVDKPVTYTIVWTVDNTANAITNTQVTATLPAYVSWLDNVSPLNEALTYDKNSGTITWNIGDIGTYTANSSRRREVSFQVSLLPNITQVDRAPVIVNQATLTAKDSFTGVSLQSLQEPVTTRFSTDPVYQEGQGVVIK